MCMQLPYRQYMCGCIPPGETYLLCKRATPLNIRRSCPDFVSLSDEDDGVWTTPLRCPPCHKKWILGRCTYYWERWWRPAFAGFAAHDTPDFRLGSNYLKRLHDEYRGVVQSLEEHLIERSAKRGSCADFYSTFNAELLEANAGYAWTVMSFLDALGSGHRE